MDDFDIAILNILQLNARCSCEQIGETIGLSASACQRRIKKLKASGLIQNEVALLDRNQLSGLVTVIVDVTLTQGGEKALDDMVKVLNGANQVQQIYYVSGEADFVVILICQNMEEFDQLSRQLFMAQGNVKKFSSKIVIQSTKTNSAIPISIHNVVVNQV